MLVPVAPHVGACCTPSRLYPVGFESFKLGSEVGFEWVSDALDWLDWERGIFMVPFSAFESSKHFECALRIS